MDINQDTEIVADTFMNPVNVAHIRQALGQGGYILTDRLYDHIWNAGESIYLIVTIVLAIVSRLTVH